MSELLELQPRREQLREMVSQLKASWEAAQPRTDLWQLADYRDADASLQSDVRRELRARSRYEVANNGLAFRVTEVWCDDVVGAPGPLLQMETGSRAVDRFIEKHFARWAKKSGLYAKFRTAVRAEAVDGEAFGVRMMSRRVRAVLSDVLLLESDRLASPFFGARHESNYVDGVHLDPQTLEPIRYDVLDAHPGHEFLNETRQFEVETYDFDEVVHVFRNLRPEQHRGVPRATCVLALSGLFRKFLEAKVTKAQLQAAIAFALKSLIEPGTPGANDNKAFDVVPLPGRQGFGIMMPDGFEPIPFKTDGDSDDIAEFKDVISQLHAGCYSMPLGRATGKYSGGDYAVIRAELKPYQNRIDLEREHLWEPLFLDVILGWWWREFRLTQKWQEFAAKQSVTVDIDDHTWQWSEAEVIVDPNREMESKRKQVAAGMGLRSQYVRTRDIDEHDERAAEELGFKNKEEFRKATAQAMGLAQPAAPGPAEPKPNKQKPVPKLRAAMEPDQVTPEVKYVLSQVLPLAKLSPADQRRLQQWLDAAPDLQANCGTGDGGFQSGNSCSGGKGGGGKGKGSSVATRAAKIVGRLGIAAAKAAVFYAGLVVVAAVAQRVLSRRGGSQVQRGLNRLAGQRLLYATVDASLLQANCGTGDGGFQHGNSCARGASSGSGGGGGGGAVTRHEQAMAAIESKAAERSQRVTDDHAEKTAKLEKRATDAEEDIDREESDMYDRHSAEESALLKRHQEQEAEAQRRWDNDEISEDDFNQVLSKQEAESSALYARHETESGMHDERAAKVQEFRAGVDSKIADLDEQLDERLAEIDAKMESELAAQVQRSTEAAVARHATEMAKLEAKHEAKREALEAKIERMQQELEDKLASEVEELADQQQTELDEIG